MQVQDTVVRCAQYQTTGDCSGILRARGLKWVDRNGSITVLRGLPAVSDTGRADPGTGRKPLRTRCDTTAVNRSCAPSDRGR